MIDHREHFRMQLYLNTFNTSLAHDQSTYSAGAKAESAVKDFDKFFQIDNDLDIPAVKEAPKSNNNWDEIPF